MSPLIYANEININRLMFCYLPRGIGAECDGVIGSGASKSTGGIIKSVAIGFRAGRLEHLRVHRRFAGCRRVVFATATVLGASKRLAGTPAGVATVSSQLGRALSVQVRWAARASALSRAPTHFHEHWQVVAIDQTDIVEVLGSRAESELRQSGGWGGSRSIAFHFTGAAVSGGT